MNGAEYNAGKSNLRWKLMVAWLWLRHPAWMLKTRARAGEPIIVPPHTFGGEVSR